MQFKLPSKLSWQTSLLCLLTLVGGLLSGIEAVSAQDKPQADAETKVSEQIAKLRPSIVTMTRIDPSTGLPTPNPNFRAGVVVDPRGYVLTSNGISQTGDRYRVRMRDLKEFDGKVVAIDEAVHLMVLKINSPQSLPAVSLDKIREPQKGDLIYLINSPATKELVPGRVVNESHRSKENQPEILADIQLPDGEGGSLIVSENGEPIGIPYGVQHAGSSKRLFVTPMKVAPQLIKAAFVVANNDEPVAGPPMPAAGAKMPDIAGLWAFETPDLPLSTTDKKGKKTKLKATVSFQQKYFIEASSELGVDYQIRDITVISLPGTDPQRLADANAKPTRLKWSAGSQKFDMLSEDTNAPSGATLEVVAANKLRLSTTSKVDTDEVRKLAAEGRISTEEMQKLLNQTWVRITVDQLNAAEQAVLKTVSKSETALLFTMPDITGVWSYAFRMQLPGRGPLRDITGNLVTFEVSRSRESGNVFEFTEKGGTRSPKMWVKWLPGTRKFQLVASEAVSKGDVTFELSADGKLLSMQAELDHNDKLQLAEQLGIDEEAVARAVRQELRRVEPSDSTTAPQDKPSNSRQSVPPVVDVKKSSPIELLIQSGMGSFNPQSAPTDFMQPVRINLQPASPLAKLLVERFADRGVKVIEFEEGKRLMIEAPPPVLAQLGDVLGQVFHEPQQPSFKVTQSTAFAERPMPTAATTLPRNGSVMGVLSESVAAKPLVEQLTAQESAAATEAEAIRQLQADGENGANLKAIAEHQRKLKALLSTAFDLKQQLEELQVKELQSKLSQLERQIAQRKTLREKIIQRRATELIEGEALKWNTSDMSTSKAASRLKAEAEGTASKKTEPIDPTQQPSPLPTPEELKAKLKPFQDQIEVARQRVRDLEPTFFKDRSNLKEMQQAMQELAQARAASTPQLKVIEAAFEELNTEYQLAELTAKALESRVTVMAEKLARGEATEVEVRAAMTAHRNSPRTLAKVLARIEKYQTVFADFGEMTFGEDDTLPPETKRNGLQPSYHRAFALAWLETALQTQVEFVSLAGLDVPFKAAVRITESNDDLQAGDLIVTFNGEFFETLDQAVASSNAAQKRSSSANAECLVLKGGLSGRRENMHLDYGDNEDCLTPTAPSEWEWYRFDVQVRRGEAIESKRIAGTCVGPDGLVVIAIAASKLDSNAPIKNYGGRDWPVQIVGTDEAHGLTLLKLGGPLRQWVKCRTELPKLNELMRCFEGGNHSDCIVSSTSLTYPEPLKGDDAFHIKSRKEGVSIDFGDKVVAEDNELQGLIVGPPYISAAMKNSSNTAIVIPAVHIQKLIEQYRQSASSKQDIPVQK